MSGREGAWPDIALQIYRPAYIRSLNLGMLVGARHPQAVQREDCHPLHYTLQNPTQQVNRFLFHPKNIKL